MKRIRQIPPEVWYSIALFLVLGIGMLIAALIKGASS